MWFDVGFKTYTTDSQKDLMMHTLWFDVGFKTYTTELNEMNDTIGCGLM